MKVHLKNDLGLNKATIRKSYEADGEYLRPEEHTERGFDIIKELLDRRTQYYTLEEARELAGIYCSSHDHCVIDNTGFGDFSAVEEYVSNQKYDKMEAALRIIESKTKNS